MPTRTVDDLQLMSGAEKFHITVVTELWAMSDVSDGELSVDGYALCRNDRNDANVKRDGGGGDLYFSLSPVFRS